MIVSIQIKVGVVVKKDRTLLDKKDRTLLDKKEEKNAQLNIANLQSKLVKHKAVKETIVIKNKKD